jgi:hypothetical protein
MQVARWCTSLNVHLVKIHGQDMDNFQFVNFFNAYDDLVA